VSRNKKRIIVIGGNSAGLSAASRAKQLNPSLDVLVIEKTPHVSYASCGIPYMIAGVVKPERMFAFSVKELQTKRGIEVWTNHEAVAIDTVKRTVSVVSNETAREQILAYDKVVLATGAKPVLPNFCVEEATNMFTIRTLVDGLRLHDMIQKQQPQKVIVVGAGALGLEIVEAFRVLGLDVVLIEKSNQVLPDVEPQITAIVEEELSTHNVVSHTNTTVEGVEYDDNRIQRVSLGVGKEPLPCDLVVFCAGIQPNVTLAEESGIAIGGNRAIIVNDQQRTRKLDIYAAGDCTETYHLVTKRSTWMPLAPAALKQGRVAGANAAGGHMRFSGVVGTTMLKVFNQQIAMTGLTIAEIKKANLDAEVVVVTQDSRAKYYPGNQPITAAVLYERNTRRLLGAQMVGMDGVAHRINVFTSALHAELSLQEIRNLDLGYAPPYAPTWDTVLVAGSAALKKAKPRLTN
jgi:NADPH-dependent 2,4-dienoyl-CoA reductase/sulfur reductase-like enzyme